MGRKKASKVVDFDPKNPDPYFAKPRFDDPFYVAEVVALVKKLLTVLYTSGVTTRHAEMLQEEYDAALLAHPELRTAGDSMFVPKGIFPARGTVPRNDVIEIRVLTTLEDKTLFLAHLMQQYARWLAATGFQQKAEYVASIVIGLRRLLNDNLSARALAGRLNS